MKISESSPETTQKF